MSGCVLAASSSSFHFSRLLIQMKEALATNNSVLGDGMRLYKFNPKVHSQSVEKAKEKASAWKLGGLSPIQLGKRVWHEIDHDEVFTRCAGLSYYFLTALIPMALFLISALGIFASHSNDVRTSLLNYLGRVMPQDAFSLVNKTL